MLVITGEFLEERSHVVWFVKARPHLGQHLHVFYHQFLQRNANKQNINICKNILSKFLKKKKKKPGYEWNHGRRQTTLNTQHQPICFPIFGSLWCKEEGISPIRPGTLLGLLTKDYKYMNQFSEYYIFKKERIRDASGKEKEITHLNKTHWLIISPVQLGITVYIIIIQYVSISLWLWTCLYLQLSNLRWDVPHQALT